MYDIIIIGAGPAGLSAAIYSLRSGKEVLLLEEKNYGGQIINTPQVENYPGIKNITGFDFATNLYEQAMGLGAKIIYEKAEKILDMGEKKVVKTTKNTYECTSIIIATGARNRHLGVDNEEKFVGAGVSYCATCDGAFFKGKEVAVVGGGNTALEDAGFLANYCSKVYLIHRRDRFRGENELALKLKERDNVEFVFDSRVIALKGEELLQGIDIENLVTGQIRELSVKGVFVAIGHMPDNEAFSNLVKLDDLGYICATEDCHTSTGGIFTAGDCRTKSIRQLTTATADGAVAGLYASEYAN